MSHRSADQQAGWDRSKGVEKQAHWQDNYGTFYAANSCGKETKADEVLCLFETWCLTQRTGQVTAITSQQKVCDFLEYAMAVKSKSKRAQRAFLEYLREDAPVLHVDKDDQNMWWPQAASSVACAMHSPNWKALTNAVDQAMNDTEIMAAGVMPASSFHQLFQDGFETGEVSKG
ncbi:hypothetical protein ABBQ32_006376 [Trebouxia sp. C0010 RCD-2024]